MRIRWTRLAEEDLRAAIEYLQNENPEAAVALVDTVFSAVEVLADGRFDGPEVDLGGARGVRSWVVRPYRLYYQRDGDVLVVLRVYHWRRGPMVR
jgi:plasmid stabilization system protein ParE